MLFRSNVGSRGAEGTNGLLLNGALPITSAIDLLERYKHVYSKKLKIDDALCLCDRIETDLQRLQGFGVIELSESSAGKAQSTSEKTAKRPSRRSQEKGKEAATEKKSPPSEKQSEKMPAKVPTEKSADAIFSSLDPVSQAVLKAMPDDTAICADALRVEDYSHGEIVASLTILEINGLVQKLPGAMYVIV